MARDIWLISDTHFGHKNILKWEDSYRAKHFDNVEQMNECIIQNWQENIKVGDIVYHLGDVMFGNKENFEKYFNKLNGSKRLVVGNHDDIKYLTQTRFFKKIMMWRKFTDHKLMFSHVPIHTDNFLTKCNINIHGHRHENGSPDGPYKSVCVEMTDYKPINIDELSFKVL